MTVLWLLLSLAFIFPGMGRPARGMQGPARQAPSLGMMSGLPLEDPDMAPGRISVRVVDRSLDDSVSGAMVSIRDARSGKVLQSVQTDASGRAIVDMSGFVGHTLVLTAESGHRTTRSVAFRMPSGKSLRFLLAFSVPRRGGRGQEATVPGNPPSDGSLEPRPRPASSAGSAEGTGPVQQGRKRPAPDRTGLWIEFRVRAVEAGRLTVTLTYLLDVAASGPVAGRLLSYPPGFEPMDDKVPSWVVTSDKGLVVQPGLKPGRYSASVTGLLRHDGDTLVVDVTEPFAVRGYGVVVRRYPQGTPSVVGPGVERREMGGSYVAYVVDRVTGRRVRFALVGLKVRSRIWAWLAVALAIGLILGAVVLVGFGRGNSGSGFQADPSSGPDGMADPGGVSGRR